MSEPRPWHAAYPPWGRAFHTPYEALVAQEPSLAPYWKTFGRRTERRYAVQQAVKMLVERPAFSRTRTRRSIRDLETGVGARVVTG